MQCTWSPVHDRKYRMRLHSWRCGDIELALSIRFQLVRRAKLAVDACKQIHVQGPAITLPACNAKAQLGFSTRSRELGAEAPGKRRRQSKENWRIRSRKLGRGALNSTRISRVANRRGTPLYWRELLP